MKVYIVIGTDYPEEYLLDVYADEDKAEERRMLEIEKGDYCNVYVKAFDIID